jgi:hypothetical protein
VLKIQQLRNVFTEQQFLTAKLFVRGLAINLADLDRWTAGVSDPYMEVVATDVNGYTEKRTTPVRGGTRHPEWLDYLEFTKRTWEKITIKILDFDGDGRQPDTLCPTQLIFLPGSYSAEFDCNPGTAFIWYALRIQV